MTDQTGNACLICELDHAPDEDVIFRDSQWGCEITPGFEVPGWIVLRARRHVIGWPGLDVGELATVGHRIRDLVAAVQEATGAPKVYVLTFGEANPHFHALIAARGDEVPAEQRTARILDRLGTARDVSAARSLVPAIRAAFEQQAAVGAGDETKVASDR